MQKHQKNSKLGVTRAASASIQGQTDNDDIGMKVFMPRPEGLCSDGTTAGMVQQQQIPQEEGNKITGCCLDRSSWWYLEDTPNVESTEKAQSTVAFAAVCEG